jgi:hypothetical protein
MNKMMLSLILTFNCLIAMDKLPSPDESANKFLQTFAPYGICKIDQCTTNPSIRYHAFIADGTEIVCSLKHSPASLNDEISATLICQPKDAQSKPTEQAMDPQWYNTVASIYYRRLCAKKYLYEQSLQILHSLDINRQKKPDESRINRMLNQHHVNWQLIGLLNKLEFRPEISSPGPSIPQHQISSHCNQQQ